jgi:starvation-inducible DNA-binding protein
MTNNVAVDELQSFLIELTDLALTGKQAHWNLQGPHFLSRHEQLDTLVADARSWSDEVAERIVAIGAPADARVATVAETTPLAGFPAGFVADDKVVGLVVDRLDTIIGRTRARVSALGDTDLVSQDLLIGIQRGLEKHRWMWATQLH